MGLQTLTPPCLLEASLPGPPPHPLSHTLAHICMHTHKHHSECLCTPTCNAHLSCVPTSPPCTRPTRPPHCRPVELASSVSQFVDIQPNDGFGTLLPLEALPLDVVFQPSKAREYSFELVCRSEGGR